MRWQAEVAALMPTVVLRATDARRAPLRGVRVSLDGELFVSSIEDNAAYAVDPGEHVFRFERTAMASSEVRVTLHGAERDRILAVTLSPNEPASAAADPEAPGARSRTLAYVLGATGLGALSLDGGLTLAGHVKREDLSSSCAPYCSQASVDGVQTLWIAAGVSAAVGVVALGVATYLWLTPSSRATRTRAAVWLAPVYPGVSVAGRFD